MLCFGALHHHSIQCTRAQCVGGAIAPRGHEQRRPADANSRLGLIDARRTMVFCRRWADFIRSLAAAVRQTSGPSNESALAAVRHAATSIGEAKPRGGEGGRLSREADGSSD